MILYILGTITALILAHAIMEAIIEYVRVRDYEIQRGKEASIINDHNEGR